MKIVVIGGGSSYIPELVQGLIDNYRELPLTELCLMDTDSRRLATLELMSRRMLKAARLPTRVTATTDRHEALHGALFVNNLIRVGGQDARISDERIPFSHGVIGQETTGPGGMMKALRSIPVVLDIAEDMTECCPGAWLVNYTNPAGIIGEALHRHGGVRAVSLCSGPRSYIQDLLHHMGTNEKEVSIEWMGLNHLGFATRVTVNGVDRTAEAIESVAGEWEVDGEWLRHLGAIPATYLKYFYHRDVYLKEAQSVGYETRGEKVRSIERRLLLQYDDPNLCEKPPLLAERGGRGYAELAIGVMRALRNNTGERFIVQVANQGSLDDIPYDATVEVPCIVDETGVQPVAQGEIPLPIRGLIQSVKAYETLTVQAGMERDRRKVVQALMAHPLVPGWGTAKPLLNDLAAANRSWLPWLM